jgi:hypothetical protein
MSNTDQTTVFEAHTPSGQIVKVFKDGRTSGLPEGTFVVNRFVGRYALCEHLLKKCVDAGLISGDDAASLGA